MGKFIDQYLLKKIFSSKLYYSILCYLLIGGFVYATYASSSFPDSLDGNNVINILNAVITNNYFLILFVYPSFSVLTIIIYSNIAAYKEIIMRVNSKKEYFNMQFRNTMKSSLILFLSLMLIIIICTNLVYNNGIEISKDYIFDSPNIIVLFVNLFKIFLSIITLQYMSLIFINIFKNKFIVSAIFIMILGLIFFSSRYESSGIFYYLLPSLHIYSHSLYLSLSSSFIISFIYYIILLSVIIMILKKIVFKCDISGEVII